MSTSALHGRAVLIVEDEPLIAMDIETTLTATGAHFTTTNSLDHALILVEHDHLSVAILDHSMGNEDNTVLYKRLSERGIPFLIYSAHYLPENRRSGGAFLSKPALPQTLVAAVEDLIRGP